MYKHNMMVMNASQEIIKELEKEAVTTADLLVLSTIVNYSHRFFTVEPSQSTLARECGLSRMTVSRAIDKFKKWNWLRTRRRIYDTSQYYLDCLFLAPELRPILSNIIFRRTFCGFKPWLEKKWYRRKPALADDVTTKTIKDTSYINLSLFSMLHMVAQAHFVDKKETWNSRFDRGTPYSPPGLSSVSVKSVGELVSVRSTAEEQLPAQLEGLDQFEAQLNNNHYWLYDSCDDLFKDEGEQVNELHQVMGLSPSQLEELSNFPTPVIAKAIASMKKKGGVEQPFYYLKRACENMVSEGQRFSRDSSNRKDKTSGSAIAPVTFRREGFEDPKTAWIRFNALKVTPFYKECMQYTPHPVPPHILGYKEEHGDSVDIQEVTAMLDMEYDWHKNGERHCPLSQEFVRYDRWACFFMDWALQRREKKEANEVHNPGTSNTPTTP
jgi:hypothetical protein